MYLGRGLRTAIFGGRGTAVFPSHPSTLPPAPSRASDGRDRLRQAWGLPSARPPKLGGAPRTHKPAHIFALTLLTPGRVRSRSFFGGRGPTPTPPRVAPIKCPARFQTSPPPTSGLRRTAPHRNRVSHGGREGKRGPVGVGEREREAEIAIEKSISSPLFPSPWFAVVGVGRCLARAWAGGGARRCSSLPAETLASKP